MPKTKVEVYDKDQLIHPFIESDHVTFSNGMKVMYPELWNNSDYSKSMTFDFNFVSPYGDPESIFRYVYVPFLALMCLAMPRQADDNGYVSPFFVRADLPGVISSDLAFCCATFFIT